MIKEFIGTGKTIDEATSAAKLGLNAPDTADVKIEVIVMPKKKVLGIFGGNDAQVKASYDDGVKEKKPKKQKPKKEAPAKKDNAPKKDAPKKANAPKPEKKAQPKKNAEAAAPAPKAEKPKITDSDIDLDYVCSYLKTIIDSFKVEDAKITAKVNDGVVEVNIECEEHGIIIGRRGETLDALQYLTSLAIKNQTSKYARVTINIGDYRDRREETLKALAKKNANYVLRTGRRYGFEPMNPYERRIIHTAVSEIDGVISKSTGSGTDRRVLIEPEGGVKNRGGNRRGGRGGNTQKPAPVDPNREKRVDRADIPKFGKIEVPNKD